MKLDANLREESLRNILSAIDEKRVINEVKNSQLMTKDNDEKEASSYNQLEARIIQLLIDNVGKDRIISALGADKIISLLDEKKVIAALIKNKSLLNALLAALKPEQLRRMLEEIRPNTDAPQPQKTK